MDILVFGAGALGSLFGGLLSERNDVALIGRTAHMEAIRRRGVRIRGATDAMCHVAAHETVPDAANPDLVIITTKAYDTSDAVDHLAAFHDSAIFISFQNGMGNEEIIATKASRVLGGVTSHGATLPEPGVVNHAGTGETAIGPFKRVSKDETAEVAEILSDSGIDTRVSPDIRRDLWMKLIVNCAINPLTAVARIPNGGLLEVAELHRIMDRAVTEAASVARAEGLDISDEEALMRASEVARLTAENRSSMLTDIEYGRPTEIDAITGYVIELAEAGGVDVPVSRTLTALVRAAEGRAIPDR